MKEQLLQIAQRIASLRDLLGISKEQMAEALGMPLSEYEKNESGECDLPYSQLYEIARVLGSDVSALITGETPKLSHYSLIRKGKGLPIEHTGQMQYLHLAYHFKDRKTDPLFVTARYDEALEERPIELSHHFGQEFDYVIEGTLRIQIDDRVFDLEPGDSLYYDSNHDHGMVAVGGKDCTFIAVVID